MAARKRSSKKDDLSQARILETVYRFRDARVLLTAFELDVFTAIGNTPRSAADVSQALDSNERATDRLMDALCGMGFLKKKNGKFSNTPLGARYLVKGTPDYMAGLMHSVHLWDSWSTLTGAVRVGSPVMARAEGGDRREDWLKAFIAAMHMRAYRQAPAVVKLLSLKGVRRVLDVGGGSGAFSMAFVRARSGIHAVVFDLPNVLPLTRKYIEDERLTNLIDTAAGDYTVNSLGAGFDLVFLSAIIHSNSAEVNRQLVRKSAEALNPGGQLVILDYIMKEDRTNPLAGAFFALNMLVGTSAGDTYTASEVRKWMGDAGFTNIRAKKSPTGNTLIMGGMQK